MTESQARERLVLAVERIADALERANDSDPLLAIERALAAEMPPSKPGDAVDFDYINGELSGAKIEYHKPVVDPNADMPPHIKRLLGVE